MDFVFWSPILLPILILGVGTDPTMPTGMQVGNEVGLERAWPCRSEHDGALSFQDQSLQLMPHGLGNTAISLEL